ncbi:FAD-dependent monooxygenase [Microlunatus ginsengisoli]|uniref:FAD-dependent monooxygenase n=1 Tax=Microlunatus ginsengisoli TaxID=363863 RepID=UPI003CD08849
MQDLRRLDDVHTLTVRIDRLRRWYRPGLLCIGDAAHAMSPIGGVGINLAVQDAVADRRPNPRRTAADRTAELPAPRSNPGQTQPSHHRHPIDPTRRTTVPRQAHADQHQTHQGAPASATRRSPPDAASSDRTDDRRRAATRTRQQDNLTSSPADTNVHPTREVRPQRPDLSHTRPRTPRPQNRRQVGAATARSSVRKRPSCGARRASVARSAR